MAIERINLFQLDLALVRPYKVSYTTFDSFAPLVAEISDSEGHVAFGEAEISPGYSHETPEGGWALLQRLAADLPGLSPTDARKKIEPFLETDPTAASVLYVALEMLDDNPQLAVHETTRVPLLQPVQSFDLEAIPDEIEKTLSEGFKTLKIKVGFEVADDLARVAAIQDAVAGRATMRIDANHSYTPEQGREFGAGLDPEGIELFEQPCANEDWDGNAAVAKVSRVPVMLDESIYGLDDIDRAGGIDGVGFVKLKLKKLGGLDRLRDGLDRIRSKGMTAVLGDGTATEIGCWQEACVARRGIDNAGEMNGFLKFKKTVFAEPLAFEDGAIVIPSGYRPTLDHDAIDSAAVARAEVSTAGGNRAAE